MSLAIAITKEVVGRRPPLTVEQLLRFRFVTVYGGGAGWGLAITANPELAQEVGATPYRRSAGVTDYERSFGADVVPVALEVMKDRAAALRATQRLTEPDADEFPF
jgi:hypothetical protein